MRVRPDLQVKGEWRERWLTRLHPDYLRSLRGGAAERSSFDDVEAFCLFVGYPRSGHSLVGALLNAHPHAVVSHELDALRYVGAGYRREQLYWLILRRDRDFVAGGTRHEGYDYAVPGAHQGRFDRLRVIGDKKGGRSTYRLADRPELLDVLAETVRVPIRIVHVVRNPFDNVATISRRTGWPLDVAADYYLRLAETNARFVGATTTREMLHLDFSEFVADPGGSLRRLGDFVGLAPDEHHLEAAASVVFAAPRRTGADVEWPASLRRELASRLAIVPWPVPGL